MSRGEHTKRALNYSAKQLKQLALFADNNL